MQQLTNHHNTEQTLTDNDDIRELIAAVDGNFDTYNEISFNESINDIRQKWPLLQEVQHQGMQRRQASQTDNVTKIKLA